MFSKLTRARNPLMHASRQQSRKLTGHFSDGKNLVDEFKKTELGRRLDKKDRMLGDTKVMINTPPRADRIQTNKNEYQASQNRIIIQPDRILRQFPALAHETQHAIDQVPPLTPDTIVRVLASEIRAWETQRQMAEEVIATFVSTMKFTGNYAEELGDTIEGFRKRYSSLNAKTLDTYVNEYAKRLGMSDSDIEDLDLEDLYEMQRDFEQNGDSAFSRWEHM